MAALASRLAEVAGARVVELTAVGGGSICAAHRAVLEDSRRVFAETLDGASEDFFTTESAGLHALRASGAVPVPRVLAVEPELLLLEWIAPGPATAARAPRTGRAAQPAGRFLGHTRTPLLPRTGRAGQSVGTAAPGRAVVRVPRGAPAAPAAATRRGQRRHRSGGRGGGGTALRPARPVRGARPGAGSDHGDLRSGNVRWAAEGPARLIDPAAQGGHPETDLALLELFGCPQLATVLDAYAEVRPLSGRADRVPLHQLQHLLVHAALFGGGHGALNGSAARAAARC